MDWKWNEWLPAGYRRRRGGRGWDREKKSPIQTRSSKRKNIWTKLNIKKKTKQNSTLTNVFFYHFLSLLGFNQNDLMIFHSLLSALFGLPSSIFNSFLYHSISMVIGLKMAEKYKPDPVLDQRKINGEQRSK